MATLSAKATTEIPATLWVCSDGDGSHSYTQLLPTDNYAGGRTGGSWAVSDNQPICIQIGSGSVLSVSQTVEIRIGYTDPTTGVSWVKTFENIFTVRSITTGDGLIHAGVGDASDPICWTVGDFDAGFHEIPVCNTLVIQYRIITPEGENAIHVADGTLSPGQHLHVVPEYLYSGLTAIGACFVGFATFKSRKTFRAKIDH